MLGRKPHIKNRQILWPNLTNISVVILFPNYTTLRQLSQVRNFHSFLCTNYNQLHWLLFSLLSRDFASKKLKSFKGATLLSFSFIHFHFLFPEIIQDDTNTQIFFTTSPVPRSKSSSSSKLQHIPKVPSSICIFHLQDDYMPARS